MSIAGGDDISEYLNGIKGKIRERPEFYTVEIEKLKEHQEVRDCEILQNEINIALAYCSTFCGNFNKAITLLDGCEASALAQQESLQLGDIYSCKGLAYHYLGDYTEALASLHMAMIHWEMIGKIDRMIRTWCNIASTYSIMGEYRQAIESYTKVLRIKRFKNDEDLAAIYINLASTYAKVEEYDSAEAYLLLGMRIAAKHQFDFIIANGKGVLGQLKLKQGKLDEAKGYLTEFLAKAREIGSQQKVAQFAASLGETLYKLGSDTEAKILLTEAQAISKELGLVEYYLHSNRLLVEME